MIGLVGGRVGHANAIHAEVQLAKHLERDYPCGMQVRVFENRHGRQAHREILQMLDVNGDGKLSTTEKTAARIAIYGHSWGASETVTLARALGEEVSPYCSPFRWTASPKAARTTGLGLYPANVAQAINFYQSDGLLHGRPLIRANDPSRTRILGNFQLDLQKAPGGLQRLPLVRTRFHEASYRDRVRSQSLEPRGVVNPFPNCKRATCDHV